MKHGKKLTRNQKIFLEEQNMESKDYLLERQDHESYTFYHVPTGKLVTIRR